MTKKISINTPNGQYYLPLSVVADNRASYYGNRGETYEYEYELVMEGGYDAIDWLMNNMDWADVEGLAVEYSDKVLVLEEDFWTSSDDVWIVND